jgi:hypothetical protein
VSGVIRLVVFEVEDYGFAGLVEFLEVVFVEDGVGDYIFFGGPVAEIAVAAALAAEREVGVLGGVGGSFADRAFMLHGADLGFEILDFGRKGKSTSSCGWWEF